MSQNANYRQIGGPGGHLAHCTTFEGHTMRGEWNHDHTVYEVFSYATMIAAFTPATGDVYVSEQRYSNTTSRQQGLCRAWLATARKERA